MISSPLQSTRLVTTDRPLLRSLVIALTAFFTLVDLFATQAILPVLSHAYGVSPAAMGIAVNASTLGMAIGSLAVALLARRIDQKTGIVASLVVLAVPTALLASAPTLATFASLRIVQGICMSAAFTLTLGYLGESSTARTQAGAFAAYITGNVASNLVGRLIAATAVEYLGLRGNFYLFAFLNLVGALLVQFTVQSTMRVQAAVADRAESIAARLRRLGTPQVLSGFGLGFCILFAFLGVFTFVNFVLVRPPLALGMMSVGFVYLVFLPSILITPLAGRAVRIWGPRPALWGGLAVAAIGLPMLLSPKLDLVLAGMVLVGVGTFFAQAVATGFVSRTAGRDRGVASGLYLASYFSGGLVGTAVLGQAFDGAGWPACVLGVAVALAVAAALGHNLKATPST
jgi:predicted MFS family arabinose efflux permease